MYLDICGRKILSSEIKGIQITDSRVLVDMKDDFISVTYRNEDEIKDARNWLRMQSITEKDLQEAITLLTIVCDNYINTYEQCQECPLFRKETCIVTTIPINWQEGENDAAVCIKDK